MEEEALRRGAALFLPKPVEPPDLLTAVAEVLTGHAAAYETIAGHRVRAAAAQQLAYETARRVLAGIERLDSTTRARLEERTLEHVSGLAHYFGVSAVALALLRNERLRVVAVSETRVLARDVDLAELLPPALAVLETGAALFLPDALVHPSFSTVCRRLDGIRSFVGVPVVIDDVPIGVLFVVATEPIDFQPEDLLLLRLFSKLASAVLSGCANDRSESELPIRYGAGIAVASMFEEMLDAELRLLDHHGGSLELVVLDADVGAAGAALHGAAHERLFSGVLSDRRIAMFKRGRDAEAGREVDAVLDSLRSQTDVRAVGIVDLAVRGLHVFNAADLVRLAQAALERTLATSGGGIRRVVIEERMGELRPTE
jgi:GAF domain-containing protein